MWFLSPITHSFHNKKITIANDKDKNINHTV